MTELTKAAALSLLQAETMIRPAVLKSTSNASVKSAESANPEPMPTSSQDRPLNDTLGPRGSQPRYLDRVSGRTLQEASNIRPIEAENGQSKVPVRPETEKQAPQIGDWSVYSSDDGKDYSALNGKKSRTLRHRQTESRSVLNPRT